MDNLFVYVAFGIAVTAFGSPAGNEYRLRKLQKRIEDLEKK